MPATTSLAWATSFASSTPTSRQAGRAAFAADLTHLSSFASEEATQLQFNVTGLPIKGLLVTGMVIGALGVLDDVTVSQASTVMVLYRANPRQGFLRLFGEGLSVGRDHIAATVNTLVLAYGRCGPARAARRQRRACGLRKRNQLRSRSRGNSRHARRLNRADRGSRPPSPRLRPVACLPLI
jgi:hypothetical protein